MSEADIELEIPKEVSVFLLDYFQIFVSTSFPFGCIVLSCLPPPAD